MEKIPPMTGGSTCATTGKRRGGSRKACNECKQQKVCHPYKTTTKDPFYFFFLKKKKKAHRI